jgi:hypothetical protein
MKTIKLTINNKRRNGTADECLIFSTRVRRGRLIFVPFTLLLSKEDAEIKVNDVHSDPATTYEIPKWFFDKKEKDFLDMGDDVVIEK